MNLEEKIVKKNMIYIGNIFNMRLDDILLPDNKLSTRQFVEHPGAVCILALDDEDNVFMVKQYRYPISKITYEIPAGKLDKNELPLECAFREFEEETGYVAEKMELIGELYPAAAYSTEIIYIYFASQLQKRKQKLDNDEFLLVEKIHLDEVLNMILSGKIKDSKTQIAIMKYFINKTLKGDK